AGLHLGVAVFHDTQTEFARTLGTRPRNRRQKLSLQPVCNLLEPREEVTDPFDLGISPFDGTLVALLDQRRHHDASARVAWNRCSALIAASEGNASRIRAPHPRSSAEQRSMSSISTARMLSCSSD